MRYILAALISVCAFFAQAQQINPVPDYIFQNRMSVGRTGVTDTAAYFSVGPRYGAIRGMMPPMVTDTASVTGTKRNGLLIFSIQKNKFVYWDSASSVWTNFGSGSVTSITAGTGLTGGTITSTGTIRVDTTVVSTKAWRQKGDDSLGALIGNATTGSGTTNYVAKFSGTKALGNSSIFDNGNVGIGTASPISISGYTILTLNNASDGGGVYLQTNGTNRGRFLNTSSDVYLGTTGAYPLIFETNATERARIFSGGNIGIGTTTDAGYKTDIAGTLRSTLGANFATTSGNVNIGGTSTFRKLSLNVSPGVTDDNGISINNGSDYFLITKAGSSYGYRGVAPDAGLIFQTSGKNVSILADGGGNITFHNNTVNEISRYSSSGELLIGTTSDAGAYALQVNGNTYINGSIRTTKDNPYLLFDGATFVGGLGSTFWGGGGVSTDVALYAANNLWMYSNGTRAAILNTGGELLLNTGTDAGDYKLQVAGSIYNTTGAVLAASSGNVGIGTTSPLEKFHVNSSGTAKAGGVFSNGTGTMYLGMESSTGGSLFVGSSAYAAVIGNGSNYPFQIATNDNVRVTVLANGNMGILTDNPTEVLDVNGVVRIRSFDSTSTAINQLYVDASGVVKKTRAPLTMSNDTIAVIGSFLVTRDAGSGTKINNAAFTTDGTVKMVTIDANFYIPESSFTQNTWVSVATLPAGYTPKKMINWTTDFTIAGASYERIDGTDFTGSTTYLSSQMRVDEDGLVQIYADIDTNTIAAGGTAYVLVPINMSFIIK
jgi:hypothetical protein